MFKEYRSLSKKDKIHIKEIYHQKYAQSDISMRLKRLNIYSIFAVVCACILLLLTFQYEQNHTLSIIMAILLFVMALVFFLGSFLIKLKLLNKITLQAKKKP